MNVECAANGDGGERFEEPTSLVTSKVNSIDVRCIALRDGQMQATYDVDCADERQLTELIQGLKQNVPDPALSFVGQNNFRGV